MYPRTIMTRFIFWLWKRYHCKRDIHLRTIGDITDDEMVCEACGKVESMIPEINDFPEWACANYGDEHHNMMDCYTCLQNYNYYMGGK